MAYRVLARKYRPQRFADVAGQDHVTRTLTNALSQNRIAHGYIFSGHRGIGKTTVARILAMALNCRNAIGSPERPSVEPCLICDNCREISAASRSDVSSMDEGHSFDVEEIDAATNRGIDDARMLSSKIQARPLKSKYRIIIMDEAHQITDAAWNSLLKTLEEPPAWVIFMFATTQPEDIPQTIRSRCQHFSFHAVKFDDILAQLRTIATAEDVTVDDEALALLAEAGDGSMRDALSIMDQAIASAPLENGKAVLQTAQIRDLMGSLPNTVFERLMEAVSAGQSAALMEDLDRLIASGNSPAAISRQLVRYLRNTLMSKIGGEQTQLLEIAQDERARVARTAKLFSEDDLTRNLQIALRTFDELNYRQEQRFHLEIGLLKLIQAQRLLPMEEILSGLATPARLGTPAVPQRTSIGANPSAGPAPRPAAPTPSAAAPTRPTIAPAAPSLSPFAARATDQLDGERLVTGHDFSRADKTEKSPGALAPEGSRPAIIDTIGALALSQPEERTVPIQESGPQIVPPPPSASASPSSNKDDLGTVRSAIARSLDAAGHSTAAVMLDDGNWNFDGSTMRIEVNARPKMIGLTFNAAAEKIIRQALTQASLPSRFIIVPGEGLASNSSAPRIRAPLGSLENEARNNPLVLQAQSVFNAEIVSVIDLRT